MRIVRDAPQFEGDASYEELDAYVKEFSTRKAEDFSNGGKLEILQMRIDFLHDLVAAILESLPLSQAERILQQVTGTDCTVEDVSDE